MLFLLDLQYYPHSPQPSLCYRVVKTRIPICTQGTRVSIDGFSSDILLIYKKSDAKRNLKGQARELKPDKSSSISKLWVSMIDSDTNLELIKARVLQFARERDWEQFHSPKNLSMAISAEAAELMEHFLWHSSEQSHEDLDSGKLRRQVEEELADIFIYAIEFANIAGIDISHSIEKKMALNAQKYPVEKSKGRSVKYTEL